MKRLLLALCALFVAAPALAYTPGTIFVDTGGSAANSGTTDGNSPPAGFTGTAASWTTGTTTITLDTNTNLTGLSTAGDQAINLGNATNATTHIFWISGVTGCTGSGACSVTVDNTAPLAAPTCSTCTGSTWNIGGRYLWPSGGTANLVEGGLRAGVTVQFNNTPATKTVAYINFRNAGDNVNGRVNIIGKAGQTVVLQTTAAGVAIINGNSITGYYVGNLTLTSASTSNAALSSMTGTIIDNIKVTGTGTGGNVLGTGGNGTVLMNSEITGGGADMIVPAGDIKLINNYIHDNTAGSCFVTTAVNINYVIIGNVFSNCFTRAIYLNGANTGQTSTNQVIGNTIYNNNATAAVEVLDADTVVFLKNNIIMNAGSGNAVSWANGTGQLNSTHSYNVFYSTSGTALNNITANSTETVGDPLFVAAGSHNFAIQNTSPAAGTGFLGALPVAAGGTTGYLDIGAVQRQVAGGGGRIIGG